MCHSDLSLLSVCIPDSVMYVSHSCEIQFIGACVSKSNSVSEKLDLCLTNNQAQVLTENENLPLQIFSHDGFQHSFGM